MYNRLMYNLFLSLQPAFSYPPAILSLAFRHSCADFYRKLSKVKPYPHISCFAHPVRLVILFLSRIPCISAPVLKNAPCANMALGRILSCTFRYKDSESRVQRQTRTRSQFGYAETELSSFHKDTEFSDIPCMGCD